MKVLVVLIVVLLARVPLHGHEIFMASTPDSGVIPCNAQSKSMTWTNTLDVPLYLVQWDILPLVDRGFSGDLQWSLWHSWGDAGSDVMQLDEGSWDHYAEPTGPHNVPRTIAPHYRTVWPGQWLTLKMRCAWSSDKTAGARASLWFTAVKP